MIMKRIFAIVIVVLTITSLLTFSETSEGTDNLDGKTKESAIEKTVLLDVNETKFLYFNSNIKTFEFDRVGDGYSYSIEEDVLKAKVEYTLTNASAYTFINTWPASGEKTVSLDNIDLVLCKNNKTAGLSLGITLTRPYSDDFYLKFSVTSFGLTQDYYYKIYVNYNKPEVYTYEFLPATMNHEGNFYTQGTIAKGEMLLPATDFRYFAIGLYSGISIHSDLTITGVADDADSRWLTTTTINFTIVATKVTTGQVFVSPAIIHFTYDRNFERAIEFTVKEGGNKLITEQSVDKNVTVLENADLTLTVNDGTTAEIVYSDADGVQKKYLWAPSDKSTSSPIATNGAGKYDVILKQLDGSTDKFSVNVIATLVPVNKIYVTCSSV